jgi:hypothetical protein
MKYSDTPTVTLDEAERYIEQLDLDYIVKAMCALLAAL